MTCRARPELRKIPEARNIEAPKTHAQRLICPIALGPQLLPKTQVQTIRGATWPDSQFRRRFSFSGFRALQEGACEFCTIGLLPPKRSFAQNSQESHLAKCWALSGAWHGVDSKLTEGGTLMICPKSARYRRRATDTHACPLPLGPRRCFCRKGLVLIPGRACMRIRRMVFITSTLAGSLHRERNATLYLSLDANCLQG